MTKPTTKPNSPPRRRLLVARSGIGAVTIVAASLFPGCNLMVRQQRCGVPDAAPCFSYQPDATSEAADAVDATARDTALDVQSADTADRDGVVDRASTDGADGA
jgi:hypothetical protein